MYEREGSECQREMMTLFMDGPQEKNVKKIREHKLRYFNLSRIIILPNMLAQLYCGRLWTIWKTNAHNKYNMWTKKFKRCRSAVALLPKFIQNLLGFIVVLFFVFQEKGPGTCTRARNHFLNRPLLLSFGTDPSQCVLLYPLNYRISSNKTRGYYFFDGSSTAGIIRMRV